MLEDVDEQDDEDETGEDLPNAIIDSREVHVDEEFFNSIIEGMRSEYKTKKRREPSTTESLANSKSLGDSISLNLVQDSSISNNELDTRGNDLTNGDAMEYSIFNEDHSSEPLFLDPRTLDFLKEQLGIAVWGVGQRRRRQQQRRITKEGDTDSESHSLNMEEDGDYYYYSNHSSSSKKKNKEKVSNNNGLDALMSAMIELESWDEEEDSTAQYFYKNEIYGNDDTNAGRDTGMAKTNRKRARRNGRNRSKSPTSVPPKKRPREEIPSNNNISSFETDEEDGYGKETTRRRGEYSLYANLTTSLREPPTTRPGNRRVSTRRGIVPSTKVPVRRVKVVRILVQGQHVTRHERLSSNSVSVKQRTKELRRLKYARKIRDTRNEDDVDSDDDKNEKGGHWEQDEGSAIIEPSLEVGYWYASFFGDSFDLVSYHTCPPLHHNTQEDEVPSSDDPLYLHLFPKRDPVHQIPSLRLLDWKRRLRRLKAKKHSKPNFKLATTGIAPIPMTCTALADVIPSLADSLSPHASWSAVEPPRRCHSNLTYGTWCNRLINVLQGSGRIFARYEFFYSDIDRAW